MKGGVALRHSVRYHDIKSVPEGRGGPARGGHRREAAERGVAPQDYRPPTLVQVARHLAEDARISPPAGGTAWAPSSVKALVDHAQSAPSLAALLS